MPEPGQDRVECSRCGESVAVADAGMLTQKNNKALWRYLCSDCLKEVGVPQGYELKRDLSHLAISTDPEEPPDDEVKSGDGTEVLVDFQGQIVTGEVPEDELTQGRVVMNRHRLVLIREVETTRIPLAAILDVSQGQISEAAQQYFDDVIRIIYERGESHRTVFVAVKRETLDKFTTLLFQALLSGTAVRVRHPVNVGGRPVNSEVRTGILELGSSACRIRNIDSKITLEFESILGVNVLDKRWPSTGDNVLAVISFRDNRVINSDFVLPTNRIQNLWRRFLQHKLEPRESNVSGTELTDAELQCMIGLYSSPNLDLSRLLDMEASSVEELLNRLTEKGMVEQQENGAQLSKMGHSLVGERFDQVV